MTSMKMNNLCTEIRREIIKYGYLSGRGHISSSLSLVEILVALYFNSSLDPEKIRRCTDDRDRVILSKGHGGLALYITLIKAGILEADKLSNFTTAKGELSTHPVYGSGNGIEMSSGSLGQGLGFACGVALSAKLREKRYGTYVIVGDGELQEGTNWESMLLASQLNLDRLVVIVDRNGLQVSGRVDGIVSLEPLKRKFEAFGFTVFEIDGHDVDAVSNALKTDHSGHPKAIIANTIKGKGISFIENKNGWHGKGLTAEQYEAAKKELSIESDG